jgi:hypothetical protein
VGQAPDPFACWLLERGLKTLDVRVRRQNENALALARWCEARPAVARVHYPGLASHPDHALATEILAGYGGMLALELAGGGEAADRFVSAVRLFSHAPSLGGVDSLVSEPRYTSHAHMTSEARAAIGIPDGFLRLSVGIEDVDDLIADVAGGLDAGARRSPSATEPRRAAAADALSRPPATACALPEVVKEYRAPVRRGSGVSFALGTRGEGFSPSSPGRAEAARARC